MTDLGDLAAFAEAGSRMTKRLVLVPEYFSLPANEVKQFRELMVGSTTNGLRCVVVDWVDDDDDTDGNVILCGWLMGLKRKRAKKK